MTLLTCQVSGVQEIIRSSHNFHQVWTFSANSVFLKSLITYYYCLKWLGLFYFALCPFISCCCVILVRLLWFLPPRRLDSVIWTILSGTQCDTWGQELDFCDSCVSLPAQGIWRQNEGHNPACITSAHCPQLFKSTVLDCRAGMQGKWSGKPRKRLKWPPSEKHGVNELGYLLRTFLCCKWSHVLLMNHAASVIHPRPSVSHQ